MSRVELRFIEGIAASLDISFKISKNERINKHIGWFVVGSRQTVGAAIQVTRRVDDPQTQIDTNKRLN